VATRPGCTAREIQSYAGFSQGYLSRLIARLIEAGVIRRVKSPEDRREQRLFLTKPGEQVFKILDERADAQARQVLRPLPADELDELASAFGTIRRLLDKTSPAETIRIRDQRAGDLGWLLERHAIVYKQEFGYSDLFESYVCDGLAVFVKNYDAKRDRLWVGEMGVRRVGAIAVHHARDRVGWAKLRWFLVEREARKRGLGSLLLDKAIGFCKRARYKGIFLWTVSDLDAARRLYERTGFALADETKTCAWAPWAHEQCWELRL